jgi:S-adenosyl methyltransferase
MTDERPAADVPEGGDGLPAVDSSVAHVARVYDYCLGGKDNFAVDRAVAAEAIATVGDRGNGARLNRAALGRAVRYMALQGVEQFLDLGSGLPTVQNTHQIAQTINPAARVVYVDNDPTVFLHGKALLADDASTIVVLADIRTPDALLAAPEVRGLLDFGKPVGLILNAVIHHLLDAEDPHGIVARYKQELVPGSYMQMTHFCDESPEVRASMEVLRRSLGRGQVRSREEIARFFDGLEMVQPGLVFLNEWQPDTLRNESEPGSTLMLCGVGRKELSSGGRPPTQVLAGSSVPAPRRRTCTRSGRPAAGPPSAPSTVKPASAIMARSAAPGWPSLVR